MKTLIIVCALFTSFLSIGQDTPQDAVTLFFEGFHARDTVKMKSVFADGMVLHSVTEGQGRAKLSSESAANLLQSIASIPAKVNIEERLLSTEVRIDGAMANVWTPYEFYVDGKFSHSGVNSFQLYRDATVWKIVHIIDTRRKL